MKIYVSDLTTGKEVELEVEPAHRLGEVMETVINALKLPRENAYSLAFGHKEYGSQHYDKTLAEIGLRDGDRLQLIVRPAGGMLPLKRLLQRLNNEEEECRREGYEFTRINLLKENKPQKITVPTVYGSEKVSAIRRYTFNFRALGYWKQGSSITQYWDHMVDIYILRHYPYSDPDKRLGAPIRLVWLTPIFHPNIAPGVQYGGTGVVCWALLRKTLKTINLLSIVKGLEYLVQNPEPNDPLVHPPICLEAARYFKEHPPIRYDIR